VLEAGSGTKFQLLSQFDIVGSNKELGGTSFFPMSLLNELFHTFQTNQLIAMVLLDLLPTLVFFLFVLLVHPSLHYIFK
jgi:hypothetical protein